MGEIRRLRLVAAATAAAVVGLVGVSPSPGLASVTQAITLQQDFVNVADLALHPLPGMVLTLSIGADRSPVLLTGQITALGLTKANVLQAANFTCVDPNGLEQRMQTDRNNEGYDAYGGRPLSVPVRFLYTPSVAGAHTCSLGIRSFAAGSLTSALRVLAGPSTYLAAAMPKPRAVSFATQFDAYDASFGVPCPGAAPCGAATHLGRGAAGLMPAGRTAFVVNSPAYTAGRSTTGLEIISDVNLTVCYAGTSSCPSYAWGPTSLWSAGTTLTARLVVRQLRLDGSTCVSTESPWVLMTITTNAHHQKLYLRIPTIRFVSTCGSAHVIRTAVQLTWVSGNPVRVDPEPYRTTGIIMEAVAP